MRKLSLNLFAETYDRKAAHLKNAVGCVFPPGNCAYMGPRNAYYHFGGARNGVPLRSRPL